MIFYVCPTRKNNLYFTNVNAQIFQVVYVSRNAKDNAVSFYHFHQMARFLGQQKTSWDEFFALYTSGHSMKATAASMYVYNTSIT